MDVFYSFQVKWPKPVGVKWQRNCSFESFPWQQRPDKRSNERREEQRESSWREWAFLYFSPSSLSVRWQNEQRHRWLLSSPNRSKNQLQKDTWKSQTLILIYLYILHSRSLINCICSTKIPELLLFPPLFPSEWEILWTCLSARFLEQSCFLHF